MADNESRDIQKSNNKKLINETITGRRLTPGRLIRSVIMAALFGIIFGLVSAGVFMAVNYYAPTLIKDMPGETAGMVTEYTEAEGTAAGDIGVTEVKDHPADDGGVTKDEEGGITQAGAEQSASEERIDSGISGQHGGTSEEEQGQPEEAEALKDGAEDGPGNASGSDAGMPSAMEGEAENHDVEGDAGSGMERSAEEETLADTEEPVEEASEDGEEEQPADIFRSFENVRRGALELADSYIVSISAITTGTTWFESEVSKSEEYAGIIVDVGENEVLLLTSAKAAEADSLRATFSNRVSVDAYVKQVSERDNLAVLAVSSVNGMEENMLADMSGVIFADDGELFEGEPVIAAGAPLGVVGSHAFGYIGYIDEYQQDYDAEETIIYADMCADVHKCSFIMDYDARLLGVAVRHIDGSVTVDGISGFVSAGSLSEMVDKLKNGEPAAYFGIAGTAVTFDMHYNGVPEGVYVTDIEPDSPAYNAGIMRGDIVYEIDGSNIIDMDGLAAEVRSREVGEKASVKVFRAAADGDYNEMAFEITAANR